KFLRAGFGALFLIRASARRRGDHDQREHGEESKKQHDPDPRRKRGTRLEFLQWFVGHCGQLVVRRDSRTRGSRTGKSEVLPTIRRSKHASVAPMPINGMKSQILTTTPAPWSAGKVTM